MKFKQPTVDDVQAVATDLGLKLSELDARTMHALMGPLLQSYEYLEAAPNALPAAKYPHRTHYFPKPDDNTLNDRMTRPAPRRWMLSQRSSKRCRNPDGKTGPPRAAICPN